MDWNEWPMWTGLILGTVGVISTEAWPTAWIIMEVNLISFLPLISSNWDIKKVCILYFIVQSVGSLTLIGRGLLQDRRTSCAKWVSLGLLLKSSIAPMHYWGVVVVLKLRPLRALVFLTWQKISPLFLLLLSSSSLLLCGILIMNAVISALSSLGRKNLVLLLFFSGLLHVSWIISAPLLERVKYFMLYVVVLVPIVFSDDDQNLALLMFNLSGIPPLRGFFIKLGILQFTMLNLSIFLLCFSSFLLYAYTRVFIVNRTKTQKMKSRTIMVCRWGLFC